MVRPVGFSLDEVPASNVYGEGVTLRLLGEFSQAVSVNGNNWSGVTIKMRIGGLTRTLRASGRTGTGNKFVIFDSYAIALNEVDNDGVEVLANTLAGPLRYGSQLHPFLGHGAWASDATIRIDGVYPRLAGSDPAVTSTDGTKIILTFTEAVSGTTAAASDFAVTVSAMTRTVSAVEASDKTVVLTLSSAVAAGETITVSYTDPTSANDENAIQDIGGNDLESFPALAVTNLGPTGVTVTSVDLTSAAGTDETYAIGDVVTATVTLSEAVSLTGTPQLELDVGATPKTADCALATDTTKLACTYTIVADDEATDGIAIGANKLSLNDASISKASGDPGGVILAHSAKTADTDHKVDGVRPTPTRASADGTALTLVWSELLNTGSTPAGTAFTVGVNSGTAPMVSSVAISASTATLTLSAAVDTTKTYTLAYAVPMTNPIEDAVGNPAEGFSEETVSTIVLTWTFTVMSDTTENGNPVIVEGGDSATVTATITNPGYTPPSNVPVTLQWDGTDIGGTDEPGSLLSGAGGVNTITVLAGQTTGTLVVSRSNDNLFSPTQTAALTAMYLGTEIDSVDLTLKDDEEPPVLTIALDRPTITEGEFAQINATLSHAYATDQSPNFLSVVAPEGSLPPLNVIDGQIVLFGNFAAGNANSVIRVQPINDTTAEDAAEVVFTIIENTDLYTVGTPASVTLTVLDNDTKPSAPQNIEAEPNYTVVALTWDDPMEDGGQTITKYEYRYSDDSRTTWGPGTGPLGWADVPMSDVGEVNRNGYTVTGLVNGTTHSFEVRAVNVAGPGTAATIDETPIDAAWAFTITDSQGDPVMSITEGGGAITARAAITNTVRFDDPVIVTLEWDGTSLGGALEGAGGISIITIAANGDSATLEITAPQDPANAPFYLPAATEALTATVEGVEIGSVALTRTDDEPKPSVTLEASTTKLTEGGNITLTATRTIASVEQSIPLATTDSDTALTGTIPTAIVIANADTEASVTVSTGENTDMDGARTVTFTLGDERGRPALHARHTQLDRRDGARRRHPAGHTAGLHRNGRVQEGRAGLGRTPERRRTGGRALRVPLLRRQRHDVGAGHHR